MAVHEQQSSSHAQQASQDLASPSFIWKMFIDGLAYQRR